MQSGQIETVFNWKSLSTQLIGSVQIENLPAAVELPALPHAVGEFVQKASDPNYGARELANIVETDSALTVELLRYVNSSLYTTGRPIRSVCDAIVRIGVNATRTHMLAAGVKAATRALKTRLINQRNFWNESLQKGLFARETARRLTLDTSLAFLGGLLQDFLLPVLTNCYDSQYLRYLESDRSDGSSIVRWERSVFGWDHASAGAFFASKWRFPDDLQCAIFLHHSPERILEESGAEFFQLFPVALASLLPDQLCQSPKGFQKLIRVASRCELIDLAEICRTVDEEQMKMAEGYEIPNHLSDLLIQAERIMHQEG